MNPFRVSEISLEQNNPLGVWDFYADGGRSLHEHPFIMIACAVGGKGFHRIGGRDLPVSEGDVFIVNPNISHCFYSRSSDPALHLYCCGFRPEALRDYYKWIGSSFPELKDFFARSQSYLYTHDNPRQEIRGILLSMLEEFSQGRPAGEYLLQCYAVILLAKLLRVRVTAEPDRERYPNQWVELCVKLIARNLNQKLTLEQVAREANISVSQLNRLFKRHTGMSVIEYVNHLRIEKIKYLLVSTPTPVEVIAAEYKLTPTYLNRLFKKQTGYTMLQYRKEFHL